MNFAKIDFREQVQKAAALTESVAPPHASRPFLPVMGLVAVLAAIYYAFIAAPMFVSTSEFTVRTQQPAIVTGLLSGLMGANSSVADLQAVQEYIQSPEMLRALDKQFGLRRSYSRPRIDLLHWLRPGASDEDFVQFYRQMIVIKLDRENSILEVDVRSFDKDLAAPMARAIIERTETFVDGMTQNLRDQTMAGALQELTRAQSAAEVARTAMANFRGASAAVDPAAAGAQVQGGEAALDAQAAAAEAALASALTYNRPDSPIVKQMQAGLASIRAQSAQLKARQAGAKLPNQVTNYETLVASRAAAEQNLAIARTAYDSARAMAQQREKYVVRIVNPDVPDKATEPRRFRDFLMVMIFALAGYAIVSLTIAGVRDHQGV